MSFVIQVYFKSKTIHAFHNVGDRKHTRQSSIDSIYAVIIFIIYKVVKYKKILLIYIVYFIFSLVKI